jgi:hypothetical protein
MSYDLIFWRGIAEDTPTNIYNRLNREEHVEGILELSRKEVVAAFLIEFPDLEEEDSELLEQGFAVVMSASPIKMIIINCSWNILKQPDILEKIQRAGFLHLRCNYYNPQINEFKLNKYASK